MINLTNHHLWWGRSEVVIICPEILHLDNIWDALSIGFEFWKIMFKVCVFKYKMMMLIMMLIFIVNVDKRPGCTELHHFLGEWMVQT